MPISMCSAMRRQALWPVLIISAVKVEAGVDPGRISAAGLGEAYPVASNGTSAGRLQNRRVEIYLPTAGQEGGGRGS